MRTFFCFVTSLSMVLGIVGSVPPPAEANDISRVLADGDALEDARLEKPRYLRDKFHPWVPPATKPAWEKMSESIRQRLLVSNGLWPMLPKTALEPMIYGKIDRGDYTIEKVYFASHPGHYVTGNLYRPTAVEGKRPGILCPHGHWPAGRFYDAGSDKSRQQIDKGAERFLSGARYPIQARLVHLARMGCVVFHYDMVGYADSKSIGHASGFTDVEAGLRLQNFMGLQTFNSIRALDFLSALPDVDAERIGVTGASGGGTQTFVLCGIDSRPTVSFPAVMVSTGMQGGCVCENAAYLRQGINNIALAALFAPKPMAMTGADDWTIAIESRGLPELKQIYSLYGKPGFVSAQAFPQFKHNYNRIARQVMYEWFNEHLKLNLDGPLVEHDFWPVRPEELSVFDDAHPLPKDAVSADGLKKYLTTIAKEQYQSLLPQTADQWREYRRVVGAAARVMFDGGLPELDMLESGKGKTAPLDDNVTLAKGVVGRKGAGEQIPYAVLLPEAFTGTVVIWFDGAGKSHLFNDEGQPKPAVKKLLESGRAVASADLFLTGEFLSDSENSQLEKVDERYQGYTFGYNRPLLSNRVRDILTVVAGLAHRPEVAKVQLVGTGDAGPWTLLAAGLSGDHVDSAVVDARGFSFKSIGDVSDPMFLPGAMKYGGIGGLAALAAPKKLTVAGWHGVAPEEQAPLKTVYKAAQGTLQLSDEPLTDEAILKALRK